MPDADHETPAPPEQPADPRKVRLGQREFELKLPASYSVRREIAVAGVQNAPRAFAAALGVCCPRLAKMDGTKAAAQYDYQPLAYGGRLIDALVESGVPYDDVMTAGLKAYQLIDQSFVSEAEVKKAEGNSEARKAG